MMIRKGSKLVDNMKFNSNENLEEQMIKQEKYYDKLNTRRWIIWMTFDILMIIFIIILLFIK